MIPRPPNIPFFGARMVAGEWLRGWIERAPLPGWIRRTLPAQREMGYSARMDRCFRWWDNAWLEERSARAVKTAVVPVILYALLAVVIASMAR